MLLRAVIYLPLCFILFSCSNITTNSNVGTQAKNRTQTAIRSSAVEVYSRDEIWQLNHINLGRVETEFCQTEAHAGLPSESNLKKVLRSKTQQLGGNAIVYDTCQSGTRYMNCVNYIRCQATAYDVTY